MAAAAAARNEEVRRKFDVETLRPTYRLLIGIPGRSNAFAISEKLGIPSEIIEDAKGRMAEEKEGFSDLLSGLEQSRLMLEKERKEAEARNAKAAALEAELERKTRKLEEEREQLLREAGEKAGKALRDAPDCAKGPEELTLGELKIGMPVKVRSMNLKGTVSTLPNAKGDLYVQIGAFRSRVNWKELERSDEEEARTLAKNRTGAGKIRMSKSMNVSAEINLTGKNADDALAELDKYLDDAVIAHVPQIWIVHGKGTGALRKAVHHYLRRQKNVDSYRLGELAEGGEGVTIVRLKKSS